MKAVIYQHIKRERSTTTEHSVVAHSQCNGETQQAVQQIKDQVRPSPPSDPAASRPAKEPEERREASPPSDPNAAAAPAKEPEERQEASPPSDPAASPRGAAAPAVATTDASASSGAGVRRDLAVNLVDLDSDEEGAA